MHSLAQQYVFSNNLFTLFNDKWDAQAAGSGCLSITPWSGYIIDEPIHTLASVPIRSAGVATIAHIISGKLAENGPRCTSGLTATSAGLSLSPWETNYIHGGLARF